MRKMKTAMPLVAALCYVCGFAVAKGIVNMQGAEWFFACLCPALAIGAFVSLASESE